MATFDIYYIKDKQCKLVDRVTGAKKDFVLESPNGEGVFECDIEEIEDSRYVDGNGFNKKKHSKYDIIARFDYSSHKMDLLELLKADEVEIPFSFTLDNDVMTKFVLLNEEAVINYFQNQPFGSGTITQEKSTSINVEGNSVTPAGNFWYDNGTPTGEKRLVTNDPNFTLEFNFIGKELTIEVHRDWGWGDFNVYIDNNLIGTYTCDSSAGSGSSEIYEYLISGLDNTGHSVRIENTSNNYITFTDFTYVEDVEKLLADEMYPHGDLTLEFGAVKAYTPAELEQFYYYKQPTPIDLMYNVESFSISDGGSSPQIVSKTYGIEDKGGFVSMNLSVTSSDKYHLKIYDGDTTGKLIAEYRNVSGNLVDSFCYYLPVNTGIVTYKILASEPLTSPSATIEHVYDTVPFNPFINKAGSTISSVTISTAVGTSNTATIIPSGDISGNPIVITGINVYSDSGLFNLKLIQGTSIRYESYQISGDITDEEEWYIPADSNPLEAKVENVSYETDETVNVEVEIKYDILQ